MSPIYLYNGAILTSGSAIATSQNCCCGEPPTETPTEPILECCIERWTSDNAGDPCPEGFTFYNLTPDGRTSCYRQKIIQNREECELDGSFVPDPPLTGVYSWGVGECIEPPKEAESCQDCCIADEIPVSIQISLSDIFCSAIFQSFGTPVGQQYYGRINQPVNVQANLILRRAGCEFFVTECGDFGDASNISLSAYATLIDGKCYMALSRLECSFKTCFDGHNTSNLCQEGSMFGGVCSWGVNLAPDEIISPIGDDCNIGAMQGDNKQTFNWSDYSGGNNFVTRRGGLIVTGSPLIRELGQGCTSVSSINAPEGNQGTFDINASYSITFN